MYVFNIVYFLFQQRIWLKSLRIHGKQQNQQINVLLSNEFPNSISSESKFKTRKYHFTFSNVKLISLAREKKNFEFCSTSKIIISV